MIWDTHRLPALDGRVYAVTGATGGIGYFAAEQLASAGAEVVLASRSAEKLRRASATLEEQVPKAVTHHVQIDLTSLASVAAAAERLAAFTRLDGIFLNGGPMQFSGKGRTVDGLPPLLGSHVVANVVLVSWLLPLLSEQGSEPGRGRIVHASSSFVKLLQGSEPGRGRIVHASSSFVKLLPMRLDNLDRMPRTGIAAYVKAKAATEVFAYELDRRIRAAGLPVSSILTHPGMGVDAKTPRRTGVRDETVRYQRSPYVLWAQGKDAAAWSGVRALTDPNAQGGEYYGPARGTRGEPIRIDTNSATANPTSAN